MCLRAAVTSDYFCLCVSPPCFLPLWLPWGRGFLPLRLSSLFPTQDWGRPTLVWDSSGGWLNSNERSFTGGGGSLGCVGQQRQHTNLFSTYPHPIHTGSAGEIPLGLGALLSVRSPSSLPSSEFSLFFLASHSQRVVPDQQHQCCLELIRNANSEDLFQTYPIRHSEGRGGRGKEGQGSVF